MLDNVRVHEHTVSAADIRTRAIGPPPLPVRLNTAGQTAATSAERAIGNLPTYATITGAARVFSR